MKYDDDHIDDFEMETSSNLAQARVSPDPTESSSTNPITNQKIHNTFCIDKNCINAVPSSERNSELDDLNIDVFNQDEFEQGILSQVDEALAAEERERSCHMLKKELSSIDTDIKSCEDELRHADKILSMMGQEVSSTNKELKHRLSSVQSQQKNKINQLKTLRTRKKFLKQKLDGLKEGTETVQVSLNGVLGLKAEENEADRMVRLGEMTPFGTIVGSSSSTTVIKTMDFENYLLSRDKKTLNPSKQKRSQANYTSQPHPQLEHATKNVTKSKRDRTNIFDTQLKQHLQKNKDLVAIQLPGKNKLSHKPKLGHNFSGDPELSDWQTDSGDESDGDDSWIPDDGGSDVDMVEELIEDKISKKISKHRKIKHELEEFSDDHPTKKKKVPTEERFHKDDGDERVFEKRLRKYQRDELMKQKHHNPQDDSDSGGGSDAEFDGGFKVPRQLWRKLYRYQKTGVRWLWELHKQQAGGILGDEMGLGKTIQLICFLAGMRFSKLNDVSLSSRYTGLGPTLIICPATVMHQWVKEMHTWWPVARVAILHSSGSSNTSPEHLIQTMARNRGIIVTSFSTVLRYQHTLLKYDWHYLILDEGHKIRNPDAQVTLVCKQFRTCHRIILSGSPMQNNLKELWSLFDFVFPGKLGTLPDFMQQFSVPIVQGGYANATNIQVQTAYKCALTLRDTIAPYLLRRMKSDVQVSLQLPNKNEQVLFCRLTDHQRDVYQEYLASKECQMILDGRFMAFPGLITLRKLCNHPDLSTGGPKLFGMQDEDEKSKKEDLNEDSDDFGYWRRSGKMIVVEALLKLWKKQNHKVLFFTQSRQLLNIMEQFVQCRDYSYLRMDGTTTITSRQPMVNHFNSDPSIFIFLLTTRVGGLGINLTGADRVILYDPDWNPSTDTQARERAWRIGQQKNVTIYRLLTTGTIEEKIYHRQIFKQFLTNRVLKDPKQRRFFKSNDLHELFMLGDDDPQTGTETSAIFAGTRSDITLKNEKSKKKHHGRRGNRFDKLKEREARLGLNKTENDQDSDDEKVKKMRKLAKRLSQKINQHKNNKLSLVDGSVVKNQCESKLEEFQCISGNQHNSIKTVSGNDSTIVEKSVAFSGQNLTNDLNLIQITESKSLTNIEDIDFVNCENGSSVQKEVTLDSKTPKKSKKSKKKSRRKRANVAVDGEEISYLDRLSVYQPENEAEESGSKQDDYVLKKLLKKSGVHSAMRHDNIMMSASPDYLLVECEADKVAKQAALALKQSRLRCQQNSLPGLPTWTGRNGIAGSPSVAARPRFGLKRNPSLALPFSTNSAAFTTVKNSSNLKEVDAKKFDGSALVSKNPSKNVMSSAELLARMRSNNFAESGQNAESIHGSDWLIQTCSIPADHVELVTDIRNFVSHGSSVGGQSTTAELLEQFKERIPAQRSAVFKAMLKQLCTFDRNSGTGIWQLKTDFRS